MMYRSKMEKHYFRGKEVFYREYGAGAYIEDKDGNIIADFICHLDAEAFLTLCDASHKFCKDVTEGYFPPVSQGIQ